MSPALYKDWRVRRSASLVAVTGSSDGLNSHRLSSSPSVKRATLLGCRPQMWTVFSVVCISFACGISIIARTRVPIMFAGSRGMLAPISRHTFLSLRLSKRPNLTSLGITQGGRNFDFYHRLFPARRRRCQTLRAMGGL